MMVLDPADKRGLTKKLQDEASKLNAWSFLVFVCVSVYSLVPLLPGLIIKFGTQLYR